MNIHIFKRTFAALALAAAVQTAALSAPLSFASGDGINEGNCRPVLGCLSSTLNNNVTISPNSAWEQNHAVPGGQWISYANTGTPGTVTPPNRSLLNTSFGVIGVPNAFFFEWFDIGSSIAPTVDLHVWADDTASVWVNDTQIFQPNTVLDSACAAGTIGCQPSEGLHVNIAPYLKLNQSNILTFGVYQRSGGPFGLLYDGGAATPEPASIALLGGGLASLGLLARRRNNKSKQLN